MGRFLMCGVAIWLTTLVGCQCCALTNHYGDLVDHISDHEHSFEGFYNPCCDLNRIGRPDWCSCTRNRWFCQCACERCKPMACPHPTLSGTVAVTADQYSEPSWADKQMRPAADSNDIVDQAETDSPDEAEDGGSPTLPAPLRGITE